MGGAFLLLFSSGGSPLIYGRMHSHRFATGDTAVRHAWAGIDGGAGGDQGSTFERPPRGPLLEDVVATAGE